MTVCTDCGHSVSTPLPEAETEAESKTEGGCASSFGLGGIAMVMVASAAGALVFRKKKD